jgi:uncharacterized protein
MKHYDEAIAEFLSSKPIIVDSSLPGGIRPFFRSLENPNNLPFSRELWIYSLPEYIARVDDPMLILIGKKDIQIDWQVDGKALENAITGKSRVSFVYPENANHVLKHEEVPKEELTPEYVGSHYNAPDSELDKEDSGAIYNWLKEESGKK